MIKRFGIVPALAFLMFSCQKNGMNDFMKATHPTADSTSDIRVVLKSSPVSLFLQAAQKIGLDSLLRPDQYFTVFAPVDNAMIAAGLDKGHIESLPADSLKKIVLFHIAQGAYSQAALTTALYSVEMKSLRKDLSIDRSSASSILYQQNLYGKISDVLYLNGEPVGKAGDTAWTASNGYIWPIQTVLQAPMQSIWQIAQSRPELSMYLAAMRINDSIYKSIGWLFRPGWGNSKTVAGDSVSYGWVVYDNLTNTQYYGLARATVFAPTNAAFEAAGFHTYKDLVNYDTTMKPGYAGYQPGVGWLYNYLPLDSILKTHVIINAGNYTAVKIPYHLSLYNDLMYNPDINNGGFNTVDFMNIYNGHAAPMPHQLLQFSGSNGAVKINWSPNAAPVGLPSDKSRHIMALNGAVYEIDQLFTPYQ